MIKEIIEFRSHFEPVPPVFGSFPGSAVKRNQCSQLPPSDHTRALVANRSRSLCKLPFRMADFHQQRVAQHCRVCGGRLTRVTYKCSTNTNKDKLKKYLGVNVEGDKEGVHPPLFCNKCWASLKKVEKATSSGTVSRTSLTQNPFPWTEHTDTCTTCEHFHHKCLGDRPRKRKTIHSCPFAVVEHMHPLHCWTAPPISHSSLSLSLSLFLRLSTV